MRNNTVSDCNIVKVSKVNNSSGSIAVLENGRNISFEVKRVYYLYNVPEAESRGGHAHYNLEQYIIAVSGSFKVILDDGLNKKTIFLNRPNLALHVVPGLWRELDKFSPGSTCMVLASELYSEQDYIRNYIDFKEWKLKR